uniref:SOSS complex subunit A homolog n=1 Tax=Ditylenchus dipsaci TaxID=166011 RepID=A0A915DG08_9BILA
MNSNNALPANLQQPKTRFPTSALLKENTKYDCSNDIADKLESQFNILQEMMAGKSEKEVHDFLNSSKDPNFNDLASGDFYLHFTYLGMAVTDGWYQALLKMNMVLLEIFYKLKSTVRQQLLFFFAEAVQNNIPKIDNVLTNLLRTISDGSEYKETCGIVQGIAEILITQRSGCDP